MSIQNATDLAQRRKHPRINIANKIGYILFDAKKNKLGRGEGRALNLSQGGVLIETQKPLKGSFVAIKADIPQKSNPRLIGRILHNHKHDNSAFHLTGLEFVGSRHDQINDLIAFFNVYNSYKKAIVIDCDPVTCRFLESILQKRSFQIWQAQSGKSAMNLIWSVQPDLIISDIVMPEPGGLDLYQTLRESPTTVDIPFIFISGENDPMDPLRGLRMGADEFLVRPLNKDSFLQAVDRVMERVSRLKGLKEDIDIAGNLKRIGLIDAIQMIENNGQTGTLFLLSPANNVTGAVYIKEGKVVNAVSGNLDGEEAFFDLAAQTNGFFKFHSHELTASNKILQENFALLMETTRLLDEAAALRHLVSGMDVRLTPLASTTQNHLFDGIPAETLSNLMNLIRSGSTINEVVANAGISRPRVSAILANLINCGVATDQKAEEKNPGIFSDKPSSPPEDKRVQGNLYKLLMHIEKISYTGTLTIHGRSRPGAIYIENGRIVNAQFGETTGREAFFRIFSERGGTCTETKGPFEIERVIDASISELFDDAQAEIALRKNLKTDFPATKMASGKYLPEHSATYEQDLDEECQAKKIVSDQGDSEDDTKNIDEDHYSANNEKLKQEGYLMGEKISEKIIHCPNCGGRSFHSGKFFFRSDGQTFEMKEFVSEVFDRHYQIKGAKDGVWNYVCDNCKTKINIRMRISSKEQLILDSYYETAS